MSNNLNLNLSHFNTTCDNKFKQNETVKMKQDTNINDIEKKKHPNVYKCTTKKLQL